MIAGSAPFISDRRSMVPLPSEAHLISLRIGPFRYAARLEDVAAVVEPSALTPLPEPSRGITGTIESARGQIFVASGRFVFGAEGECAGDGRVIVFHGDPPFGLWVDAVTGSRDAESSAFEELPSTLGTPSRLLASVAVHGPDGMLDVLVDARALSSELFDSHQRERETPDRAWGDALAKLDDSRVVEVTLRGDDRAWAIPTDCIRLIAAYIPPQPIARAADGVTGMLTWRGRPIPAISLAMRLGLAASPDSSQLLVVVGHPAESDALAALEIDSVRGLHERVVRADDQCLVNDGRQLHWLALDEIV